MTEEEIENKKQIALDYINSRYEDIKTPFYHNDADYKMAYDQIMLTYNNALLKQREGNNG